MLHSSLPVHLCKGCFGRCANALLPFLLILLPLTTAGAQTSGQENKGFLIQSQPGGATVLIEDEIIGKTPCTFPYQLAGKYRLFAEKRGYESVSREIDFSTRKIETITFMLSPKTRGKAVLRSFFVTGWGQNYSEQPLKGRILMGLQAACLLSLGYTHQRCLHFEDVYRVQLDSCRISSLKYDREAAAWQRLHSAHQDWKQADQWRQAMLYTAIGLHALNFLDALFIFPKNLRQIEFLAAPGVSQPLPAGSGFTISYTVPL